MTASNLKNYKIVLANQSTNNIVNNSIILVIDLKNYTNDLLQLKGEFIFTFKIAKKISILFYIGIKNYNFT